MPANPKYLTTSKWQRFAKISAGIIGGYFVAVSFHLALALWLNHKIVLISSLYTLFILWGVLLILPFLFKNGWKAWLYYISIIIICGVAIYFGKLFRPII